MNPAEKICARCQKTKKVEDFSCFGKGAYCKPCNNEFQKESRARRKIGRTYQVYGLADPRNRKIYYVGCSLLPELRLMAHMREARTYPDQNPRKAAWILALKRKGLKPDLIILEIVQNRRQRFIREQQWIDKLIQENEPLTNCIPGYPRRYLADGSAS